MTSTTPHRIIELWPTLSPETQSVLVEAAENLAVAQKTRPFTEREIDLVAQSKSDFAEGRVLDEQDYEESMAVFMAGLKAKARSQ